MNGYQEFIERKMVSADMVGIEPPAINKKLFPYQADLVKWALRRGRAAIFADTGMGKTFMQAEWANTVASKGRVLILAPLSVAQQTVREAAKLKVYIDYRRKDQGDRITITNYEMMDAFDPSKFEAVVLDESSIIKSYSGKIRDEIISRFAKIPFKLACTATPSPNDYTELGNHSEFLGIKTRSEMLAEYFVHDMDNTQDWRLKGHAVDAFWRWVSTWAALIRKPSDLGYSDKGFELPALVMHDEVVEIDHSDAWKEGELFALEVKTLSDQRTTRRATMDARVKIAELLSRGKEQVLIWCELNDEADEVTAAIQGAVQVKGSDDPDFKSKAMLDFAEGKIRVLVSKTKICGFGMNFQSCHKMIFMGASHSYESTYQAIRRCWRFGQKERVDVWVIRASTEGAIIENFKRKEQDAEEMGKEMAARVHDVLLAEIRGTKKEWNEYNPQVNMEVPTWIGEEI